MNIFNYWNQLSFTRMTRSKSKLLVNKMELTLKCSIKSGRMNITAIVSYTPLIITITINDAWLDSVPGLARFCLADQWQERCSYNDHVTCNACMWHASLHVKYTASVCFYIPLLHAKNNIISTYVICHHTMLAHV